MCYHCLSVPGGWQTRHKSGELVGPVFNRVKDLWTWQEKSLPTPEKPETLEQFKLRLRLSAETA